MKLFVLSAGLGTRLRPITDKIPKPALPILNVPMFFYSQHYFEKADIVANTFCLEQKLKEILSWLKKDILFVSDGKEVLGTGGGIANAHAHLQEENFWVANGDSIFLTDHNFREGTEHIHQVQKAICTLVVMDHPDVGKKFGGIWVDKNDNVLDMGKTKPDGAVRGYHFTGFRILSQKIFKYLPQGSSELFDILKIAMQKGERVAISKTNGEFFETGNEKDFIATTQKLLCYFKEEKYQYLVSLLKKYTPQSRLNDFSTSLKMESQPSLKNLFIGRDFKLFHDVQLEGFVVAGNNVTIKEKSLLKNVVILDDCLIEENAQYQNQIIY